MKHSVAPQSRKAISLAFFCAVCNVMGILIALRFGRNTSLLIARAKANLLRRGKNPGGTSVSSTRPPPYLDFRASLSSNSGGLRRCLLSGIGVVSSLGLQPEGLFACLPRVRAIRGFSWDNGVECARAFCKGGRVLCVFRCPLDSGIGVGQESCTFCQSP